MTVGRSKDIEETNQQINKPNPVENGLTWLRHDVSAQAGVIDLLILEGKYSINQIADKLGETFVPTDRTSRIKRIKSHFAHLEDSFHRGVAPHRLKIHKDSPVHFIPQEPHNESDNSANRSQSMNPAWSRDELILSLDFYLRHKPRVPGKQSDEIRQLSDLLNELGERLGRTGFEKYRNPNGTYMKLMNFRRFDPDYANAGGKGLSHGGKLEEVIWNEFALNPDHLRKTAESIRRNLTAPETSPSDSDISEDYEAEEGRLLTRLHTYRERNRKLIAEKKASVRRKAGRLVCEVCGFDFEAAYGERGTGFIECHHTKPVTELDPGQKTKLDDLALLCANCHRMVHAKKPWLNLADLRKLFRTT